MGINITKTSTIDNASIPFGKNGCLMMVKIDEVTGDTADGSGGKLLVYKDGVLHNNFVMVWTNSFTGTTKYLGSAQSFMDTFGLRKQRAEAIEDYITKRLHNEIPILATKPGELEDADIVTFANVFDAYRDAYGENSDEFKKMRSPEIETLVDNNVYVRNVLAKLGQMLEIGFNETYHEGVADSIVYLIRTSKHINVKGEVSGPTMSSVEDIFRIVRDKLTLEPVDQIPPYLIQDENKPLFLKD